MLARGLAWHKILKLNAQFDEKNIVRYRSFKSVIILCIFWSSSSFAFDLSIAADGEVHDLVTGKKTKVAKGENLSITERNPLWVESNGRVPVLLVPMKAEKGAIKIDSPNVAQVFREEKEIRIDQELSEVTMALTEIHRYIADSKFSVAQQKANELRAKYPNVKFLDFIDASISFLMGDKTRAISSVNSGLKAHPEYAQGKELKQKLEGGVK